MTRSVVATLPTVCFFLGALTAVSRTGASAQEAFSSRCGAAVHVDARRGWNWLPQGKIFCPLAADPKAERSFVSYLMGDFATIANPAADPDTNIASIGLGDVFPIFRIADDASGNGVQLDLAGAVFSQFNLDEPSFDLINADYIVGLPLTFRQGSFSTRLRVYHQSSHLGDEFLLSREPERVNLSFESLELIVSQEAGPLRVYGGGETFFRRDPADLAERLAHAGVELRSSLGESVGVLLAVDSKAVDDVEWTMAWSARAGISIARVPSPGHPPQVISFYVDLYEGAAPYGQFYRDSIRYWGVGLALIR